MPRLFDEDENALDFCLKCFPSEQEAERIYGEAGKNSYEEVHPDYDDTEYRCEKCNKPLTDKDN